MKAFYQIATPHQDVNQGKLTMDIFAADLWKVFKQEGPDEYKDPDLFFKKTYLTNGLNRLLQSVENRVKGNGGDSVIQLQTPFGGGKTHSLIALLHKTKKWKAKPVVIVGTVLSGKETLWGTLEEQLTGKIQKMKDLTSPGKEAILSLIEKHQPVVILMDEVLQYFTKAAGTKVGDSNLAAQSLAFIHEITEAISSTSNSVLVITLPSSILEQYDEKTEQMFRKLQHITGRIEKIESPVEDSEISSVIRKRLFSKIIESEVKKIVDEYINYATKEKLITNDMEISEYRKKFIDSYPFMPEVIDVLYHRWGSFPNFQRTRGVLRLLSLVVHDLLEKERLPYISVADINLSNQEIRQELVKHIGSEYNSVIAQDITDPDSGCKKIDKSLPKTYGAYHFASRIGTSIFMYSFSGGAEKGITLNELKRVATVIDITPSIILEALEQLKQKLYFFQQQNDKFLFSNQPNLNRIVIVKMENIKEEEVKELEEKLLKENIRGEIFKVYMWINDTNSIPDTEDLKLIILPKKNQEFIKNVIEKKGESKRINPNIIFFLYPNEDERNNFYHLLKEYLAYLSLDKDQSLKFSQDQIKNINIKIKEIEKNLKDELRRFYRIIAIPEKEGFSEIDMGIPTIGEKSSIDKEIYEKLRSEDKILDSLSPLIIKQKYLEKKDYVYTKQLIQLSYRTPGEIRYKNRDVLRSSIQGGVNQGLFGLGELEGETIKCIYFETTPSVSFSDNEILINEEICKKQTQKETYPEIEKTVAYNTVGESKTTQATPQSTTQQRFYETSELQQERKDLIKKLRLKFTLPRGRASDILKVINIISMNFNEVSITLQAEKNGISKKDYEDKIKEALTQIGIEPEIEELE